MEFKLSDWIVNEGNVFEFTKIEINSTAVIYYEIRKQINIDNITEVDLFLNSTVNTTKEISITRGLSIEKVINEFLFNDVESLPQLNKVYMVLGLLPLWLHVKYRINASAPMYHMSQYREQYENLKSDYCKQWLDADETDFINAQLALCDTLEKELRKPVYTEFDILGITETPHKFKQELTLTIVKRRAYLNEKLNSLSTSIDAPKPTETENKIAAKYYALYHWILIEMGKEKHFEKDQNDWYSRTEIEHFAQSRYPTSPQSFYRAFVNIDITKKHEIAIAFKTGYKMKIISMSNNNGEIIKHLKKYPN